MAACFRILLLFLMLFINCHVLAQGYYLMATVAGSGSSSTSGNGGPATSAGLGSFDQMWVDSLGNLYLPDSSYPQVRKVNTAGIITRLFGSGNISTSGNGGPALSVDLDGADCVFGDTAGNMYLSSYNYYIWFYNHTTGQVSRFAGVPGNRGYSGDGGPATSAKIYYPMGLFLSSIGVLYFADVSNTVIRAIDTKTNIITTAAGDPYASSTGDGGPATSAQMYPCGVWGNTAGVLYISDSGYNRIRKVATDGIITTIAGGAGELNFPLNCQEDSLGNLYISDTDNHRVKMISGVTGNITTIAGNGSTIIVDSSIHVATAVGIFPSMIQLDSLGNIYFQDNSYIRKLFVSTAMPTVIPSAVPTIRPSVAPSIVPSTIPTTTPTIVPTAIPTTTPTIAPSAIPTTTPTIVPSAIPTPTIVPSAIPTTTPTIVPSAIPTTTPTIVASTAPSNSPTLSPSLVPSFRPSVTNVTVDSSSRSQRLSDLHIFYATFFPAFFVVICVFLGVGCYLWMRHKDKPTLKYDQINLDVATNGNENKKTVVKSRSFINGHYSNDCLLLLFLLHFHFF